MKIVITKLHPFIIHVLIRLWGLLSFLLDIINVLIFPIKKIKFNAHALYALLLAIGIEAYHYCVKNGFDLIRVAKVYGICIALVLAIKALFRPFTSLCHRIRKNYRSYFVSYGIPRYIVLSSKEYYKEMPKKMICKVQTDFDEPVQYFTDLNQLFVLLKQAGHIFVYNASDDKYKEKAEDSCVDPALTPLYIETSVSTEGTFVASEAFWIENYLIGEFYNPEQRPYIEAYNQESI